MVHVLVQAVHVSAIPWRKVFKKENLEVILACTIFGFIVTAYTRPLERHVRLEGWELLVTFSGAVQIVCVVTLVIAGLSTIPRKTLGDNEPRQVAVRPTIQPSHR